MRPAEENRYLRHPSDRAGVISPQRVGGLSGPTSQEGVALAGINRKKEELERSLRSFREEDTAHKGKEDETEGTTEEFIERIKHRFEETQQMLFKMEKPGGTR